MSTKSKPVIGHWKKMFNSKYLGSWDFEHGKDVTAVVAFVAIEEMHNPSDHQIENKPVVHFKGGLKPMVLNKTNSKIIAKVLKSDNVEDWTGGKLLIGIDSVKAFGEVVDAVRVRPVSPAKKTLDDNRFRKMLESIEAGKFTIQAAREKFDLTKGQIQELENLAV